MGEKKEEDEDDHVLYAPQESRACNDDEQDWGRGVIIVLLTLDFAGGTVVAIQDGTLPLQIEETVYSSVSDSSECNFQRWDGSLTATILGLA